MKAKVSRKKEVIKIRGEINEVDTDTLKKKIDKPLGSFTKKKKKIQERAQMKSEIEEEILLILIPQKYEMS